MNVKVPVASAAPTATDNNVHATNVARPTYLTPAPARVSPADAAKYLGVSEQTLAVWRCTKRYALNYIKVGRLVRYNISDLDAFLAQRTIHASSGKEEV